MKRKQFIAVLMAMAVASPSTILVAGEQVESTELTGTMETDRTEEQSVTLIGGTSGETAIDVQLEEIQELNGEEPNVKNKYISDQGQITEINKTGKYYMVLVGEPIDGIIYIVDESEMIIDAGTLEFLQASDLKVGMEITVVVPKNAPMTMSLPAQVSGQIAIIVNSTEAFTEMSYFDEELVNEENTLKLNIDSETYITNTKGERRIFTAEDIQNHSAVVIYTASTRSIPAQTTPKMVIVLPNITDGIGEVAKEDVKETSPVEESCDLPVQSTKSTLVAVRDLAEKYGYDVKWDNNDKSATLTKGENTIIITVGELEVIYNDNKYMFEEKAQLEGKKAYVSSELEKLLQLSIA